MNPSIGIVADSGSDLDPALARSYGVTIVPLSVRFGEQSFTDGVELSSDDFWHRVRAGAKMPETVAPSVGQFQEAFEGLLHSGATGVQCITISSDISATFQAATIASKEFDESKVSVIDSRSASLGTGLQVIGASRLASEGADLAVVGSAVHASTERARLYGTLDTIEYLRKGGRIGEASALVGSVLTVKPIIAIRGGHVVEAGRARTCGRAIRAMASRLPPDFVGEIAVLSGASPDAGELADVVSDRCPDATLLRCSVGPVIGSHVGPGVLGVSFIEPE